MAHSWPFPWGLWARINPTKILQYMYLIGVHCPIMDLELAPTDVHVQENRLICDILCQSSFRYTWHSEVFPWVLLLSIRICECFAPQRLILRFPETLATVYYLEKLGTSALEYLSGSVYTSRRLLRVGPDILWNYIGSSAGSGLGPSTSTYKCFCPRNMSDINLSGLGDQPRPMIEPDCHSTPLIMKLYIWQLWALGSRQIIQSGRMAIYVFVVEDQEGRYITTRWFRACAIIQY